MMEHQNGHVLFGGANRLLLFLVTNVATIDTAKQAIVCRAYQR
jgi:hypothetical protein